MTTEREPEGNPYAIGKTSGYSHQSVMSGLVSFAARGGFEPPTHTCYPSVWIPCRSSTELTSHC